MRFSLTPSWKGVVRRLDLAMWGETAPLMNRSVMISQIGRWSSSSYQPLRLTPDSCRPFQIKSVTWAENEVPVEYPIAEILPDRPSAFMACPVCSPPTPSTTTSTPAPSVGRATPSVIVSLERSMMFSYPKSAASFCLSDEPAVETPQEGQLSRSQLFRRLHFPRSFPAFALGQPTTPDLPNVKIPRISPGSVRPDGADIGSGFPGQTF